MRSKTQGYPATANCAQVIQEVKALVLTLFVQEIGAWPKSHKLQF